MRKHAVLTVVVLTLASAAQAQTMRNPPGAGTPALGGPTRNPTGTSSAPAKPAAAGDASGGQNHAPDRPPLGSESAARIGAGGVGTDVQGHSLGVGPVGGGNNGTGAGGGSPSVINPSGANGGTGAGSLSASRPNGGSPQNGAKSAPMGANGVRKVQ